MILFFLKAITTPGPETEEAAWQAVLPAVDQLKEFYDFSLELGLFLFNFSQKKKKKLEKKSAVINNYCYNRGLFPQTPRCPL